jgi:fumarate hydratase class II
VVLATLQRAALCLQWNAHFSILPGAMNENFRSESDSMGAMQVPASAYYGAQTARAIENFPISNLRFSRSFIRALGLIKKNAALTNQDLGSLKPEIAGAVAKAAQEVADGKWDGEFLV